MKINLDASLLLVDLTREDRIVPRAFEGSLRLRKPIGSGVRTLQIETGYIMGITKLQIVLTDEQFVALWATMNIEVNKEA